jgi:hypothetical protein
MNSLRGLFALKLAVRDAPPQDRTEHRLGVLRCANDAAHAKVKEEAAKDDEHRWLLVYFASWFR